MKNLSVYVFFSLIYAYSFAQILGGEIRYNSLPSPPFPPNTFTISFIKYSAYPSITNLNYSVIWTGDGDSINAPRTDSVLLCNNVLKSTYTFTHIFPWCVSCNYTVYHYDTNTVTNSNNFPNIQSGYPSFSSLIVINQFLFLENPSSIYFDNSPVTIVAKDTILKLNFSAIDSVDHDSLSYQLLDLDANDSLYYIPNGFSLNQLSGEIIWNMPDTAGWYHFGIVVKEW